MSSTTCSAVGCTNNPVRNPELLFHQFPKDRKRHKVGVDKFEPNGAVSAATDPTSGHPGRTTYGRVCGLYPDDKEPVNVECRLGTFADYDEEYQVAFAGPRELLARMRNTYADGMGSVPVVVHGIDLDDFLGYCPGGGMSPLIRAIATGGPWARKPLLKG
ncbi:hypothetical protein HPB47_027064 [Ixodes persulcatus]|uniref:Uncharacterized protein n=1 Tax=Ixodes persulcatus TaxID=34615 RepID=A0AC60PYX0_IXOPE|nr:hypothetical protein HPB47_027064 [Ixodes persulcatus]